jgi:hypothetical protein
MSAIPPKGDLDNYFSNARRMLVSLVNRGAHGHAPREADLDDV